MQGLNSVGRPVRFLMSDVDRADAHIGHVQCGPRPRGRRRCFTDAGLVTSERIEALTDELVTPAYGVLTADELDELITRLKPIAAPAQAVEV